MFTRATRQAIVEDFARRHSGQFDAELFVQEVRRRGEAHPAFGWFDWDDSSAAHEHRLWQARTFVRDLVVKFSIEEISRTGSVRVIQTEMPLVISPLTGRVDGGGYIVSNPHDPEHMATFCKEAASALKSWIKRFEACLIHVGTNASHFSRVAELLDDDGEPD